MSATTYRVGSTQRHVLLTLANRGASPATDWAAWYPLDPSSARAALGRLYKRGLVKPVGFRTSHQYAISREVRTWDITPAGLALLGAAEEA